MNWDDFSCPVCKTQDFVPPSGNSNSPVIIIGTAPGDEEIDKGIPFVGATGGVLETELYKLGVRLSMFRLANLWFHPPHKTDHPLYKDCLSYSAGILIKEAQTRKALLLMGAKTVEFFCDTKVSTVCGLQVKSVYLSTPIIYACVNPADVFHGSIGELRLALTKFVKRLEQENIL